MWSPAPLTAWWVRSANTLPAANLVARVPRRVLEALRPPQPTVAKTARLSQRRASVTRPLAQSTARCPTGLIGVLVLPAATANTTAIAPSRCTLNMVERHAPLSRRRKPAHLVLALSTVLRLPGIRSVDAQPHVVVVFRRARALLWCRLPSVATIVAP